MTERKALIYQATVVMMVLKTMLMIVMKMKTIGQLIKV